MTERIDHVAEALAGLAGLPSSDDQRDYVYNRIAEAQVHATLALVAEHRVSNLIAISRSEDVEPGVAVSALVDAEERLGL